VGGFGQEQEELNSAALTAEGRLPAPGFEVGAGGILPIDWTRCRRALGLFVIGSAVLLAPVAFRGDGFRAPALQVALETMTTLLAFASAALLRGRFVASRRSRDLLLFGAVCTLAWANLLLGLAPVALDIHAAAVVGGAELWGGLLVAGAFAAAALVSANAVVVSFRRPALCVAMAAPAVVAVAALTGVALRDRLLSGGTTLGHPLGVLLVVSATGLFAVGASGFARRHWAEGDPTAALLSGVVVLLAAASFYRLVPHSVPPDQLGPAQLLRTFAYPLLLVVAVRQELAAQALKAKAAALVERRRVARDLHDGIVQDLAFIAAHSAQLATDLGGDHPVVIAAKRALAVSRSTISGLSDPTGATVHEALEAIAGELRARFGVAIVIHAPLDAEPTGDTRVQVTRIAREAIANAARHGHAKNVIVTLGRADGMTALRVTDDGRGIRGPADGSVREGFGLRSMRERATESGGHLTIRQARHGGTELEVVLP
jgi:signal transduction histidine kinase